MGKTLVTIFKEEGVHPWASILVGGVWLTVVLFSSMQLLQTPLKQEDLMKISGVLLTEPEVTFPFHSGKVHKAGSITLRLTSDSDVTFAITGESYNATQVNLVVDHLYRLDSVEMLVDASAYQRLSQQQTGSTGWKLWPESHEDIPVYGLKAHQEDYLLWSNIDQSIHLSEVFTLLVWIIFGIWLFRDVLQKQIYPKA